MVQVFTWYVTYSHLNIPNVLMANDVVTPAFSPREVIVDTNHYLVVFTHSNTFGIVSVMVFLVWVGLRYTFL